MHGCLNECGFYIDRHGIKVGATQRRYTLKASTHNEQAFSIHQIEKVIVLAHAHSGDDDISALMRERILVIFLFSRRLSRYVVPPSRAPDPLQANVVPVHR